MNSQGTDRSQLLSKRKNEEGQDVIILQMGDKLTECIVPEGGIEFGGKFLSADEIIGIGYFSIAIINSCLGRKGTTSSKKKRI